MKKYHLILIACLTGFLLAFSWPTSGFAPLIFVAWIPLLWVEQYIASPKHSSRFGPFAGFFYSYLPFFIFNLIQTFWIKNVSLAAIAIPFLEALFMATVFQLFHYTKCKRYSGQNVWIVLMCYWLAFEYLQLYWDLTFPWLLMGNVFSEMPSMIQWYEYTGIFGGCVWIFLANFVGLRLLNSFLEQQFLSDKIRCLLFFVLMIALPWLISLGIGARYEIEKEKPTDVVVLQPNLDPFGEQFEIDPSEVAFAMSRLAEPLTDSATHFILSPESCLQDYPWEHQLHQSYSLYILETFIHRYPRVEWLTGISTRKLLKETDKSTAKRQRMYGDSLVSYESCNTALFVDRSASYPLIHKIKLTPCVEKMPFHSVFKYVEKWALNIGGVSGSLGVDFKRSPMVSELNGRTFLPIICYESVYGEFMAKVVAQGCDFIFILTNDGWWGDTPGYKQHCSYARLRAIESRRYIARSANTGTSCFIDPKGEIYQKTPYWEKSAIKQTLLAQSKQTFYAKHGDFIARYASIASVFLLIITLVRSMMQKRTLKNR